MEAELFFAALYKHEAPQHLAAGPWVTQEEAQKYCDQRRYPHVVVSMKITLTEVK